MEVGSAVADVQSGSAEVWVASKSPTGAQSAVADAVGLSADKVTLHVIRGGGSFGRRIYHEPAVEAALRVAGDRQAREADVDPQR